MDETFGLPTVTDILRELEKPGRDPRPAFKTATFQEGVEKISDLKPGMVLEGVVTNVAAFGAFVDIGVHQDGLVHVSAMSKTFIKDPREVVKPGDIVRVKVMEVDARAQAHFAEHAARRSAGRGWQAAGGRRERAGGAEADERRTEGQTAQGRRRWRVRGCLPPRGAQRQ